MKRTTYIILGMLLAGCVAISGFIYYYSTLGYSVGRERCLEGETRLLTLPAGRVVQLVRSNPSRWVNRLHLRVEPAEGDEAVLELPDKLVPYLRQEVRGDTLRLALDIDWDALLAEVKGGRRQQLQLPALHLRIPSAVDRIQSESFGIQVCLNGLVRDSLALQVNSHVQVEQCRFGALEAEAYSLKLNSGEAQRLHINLDKTPNWRVKTDSFHIDTEYLSATAPAYNVQIAKGECRRVRWMPLSDKAQLYIRLDEAAEVVVDREDAAE